MRGGGPVLLGGVALPGRNKSCLFGLGSAPADHLFFAGSPTLPSRYLPTGSKPPGRRPPAVLAHCRDRQSKGRPYFSAYRARAVQVPQACATALPYSCLPPCSSPSSRSFVAWQSSCACLKPADALCHVGVLDGFNMRLQHRSHCRQRARRNASRRGRLQ